MGTSAVIQSPDGNFAVEQQDDYGEIGMGSPAFGHITFRGADVQFPDYLFGEAVVFSPDSRFVALEQLVESRPFRTKIIAVELPHGTVHFIRLQAQGTATPQRWDSATRLIYRVWSVGSAAEVQSWDAPPPAPSRKEEGIVQFIEVTLTTRTRTRHYKVPVPIPPQRYRWRILVALAVGAGLLPWTDSATIGVAVNFGFPILTAMFLAAYWQEATLSHKAMLSLGASCFTFLLRLIPSSLYAGFNYVDHLFHTDSLARRAFLILFVIHLAIPFLALIPYHFILRKRAKTLSKTGLAIPISPD